MQSTKSAFAIYEDLDVEVAGIEPASDDVEPGLLRAQLAALFLSPRDLASVSRKRAQLSKSPHSPDNEDCEQWLSR